jgi:hypothetical protein
MFNYLKAGRKVFCLWSIRRVKTVILVILKLDMIQRRLSRDAHPPFIPVVLTKRVIEQRLSAPQPCTQLSELLLLLHC